MQSHPMLVGQVQPPTQAGNDERTYALHSLNVYRDSKPAMSFVWRDMFVMHVMHVNVSAEAGEA